MEEFSIGFILAIFSLAGAIAWDVLQRYQQEKRQDESIIIALKSEAKGNLTIIARNIEIVKVELGIIDEERTVIEPLALLRNGGWDLLRVSIPKKLTIQPDTLAELNNLFVKVEQLNEVIRSREIYRANNMTVISMHQRLKIYDQTILRDTSSVILSIDRLKPILDINIEMDIGTEKLLGLERA